jgi:hypothetical protein
MPAFSSTCWPGTASQLRFPPRSRSALLAPGTFRDGLPSLVINQFRARQRFTFLIHHLNPEFPAPWERAVRQIPSCPLQWPGPGGARGHATRTRDDEAPRHSLFAQYAIRDQRAPITIPRKMAREARRKASRHPEPASPRETVTHTLRERGFLSSFRHLMDLLTLWDDCRAPQGYLVMLGWGARCPSLTWRTRQFDVGGNPMRRQASAVSCVALSLSQLPTRPMSSSSS